VLDARDNIIDGLKLSGIDLMNARC
jgi:hypothetical protein